MKARSKLSTIIFALAALPAVAAASTITVDSLANRIPYDQNPNTYGEPASNYQNQVNLTVGPGTYSFAFVAGAWNAWGSGACTLGNCGDGAGWMTSVAFDMGPGSQIQGLGNGSRWATPALALADAQAQPVYTQTFAAKTTLRFFIADTIYTQVYQPYWNQGQVTLNVAAVPEPETYAMMLAGLGLFGFMARRKKLA
jgi:hypothetical protein